jgi:hypothetical protein
MASVLFVFIVLYSVNKERRRRLLFHFSLTDIHFCFLQFVLLFLCEMHFLAVLFVFALVLVVSGVHGVEPEPVILFPGLTDSTLLANLHRTSPPHSFCPSDTGKNWTVVWVNQTYFLPQFDDCMMYYLEREYDQEKGVFHNKPGILMDVEDYGGVDGILYLASEDKPYLQPLIDYFHRKGGYVVGKTLRAAPFDWRAGTLENCVDGQYEALKGLCEETYAMNEGKKVHFLTHSYGGSFAHDFLTRYATQEWKDKYIASLITMGAPWTGSSLSIETVINSKVLGPLFGSDAFQKLWRTITSFVTMFPREKYWEDHIIVYTPSKNYTVCSQSLLGYMWWAWVGKSWSDVSYSLCSCISGKLGTRH